MRELVELNLTRDQKYLNLNIDEHLTSGILCLRGKIYLDIEMKMIPEQGDRMQSL